ncbi:uncharacterized protein BJ212DRAFT_1478507 [Suillus subaureus]|uniref:Uncharacterized protein n=1 Tax=Suillus subaureus TaxID=48587 RepID=A0A9P7EFI3_9AGAM|nr:uncharacterized protein BJ212DRAFT_1478507 [Suillus subaureus]KAG1820392.1 hypothetical protein BJ212DRAFT_1478507 [Suillus subaureus]
MPWDEPLDHGDEPFDLSFPPVHGVHPSLTLKVAVVHACDNQDGTLFDSLVDSKLVLDQCPDVDLQDIATSSATPLYCVRSAIPITPHNLTEALDWHHDKKNGTYLCSIAAGANSVDYVIGGCNKIPIDASDKGIHLRRVVLKLCPLGHQVRPRAFDKLAQAVEVRFDQHDNIDDLDASIQLGHEAVSLCPERHASRGAYLNNLAFSLVSRFDHQGKPNDLDEAISLHE